MNPAPETREGRLQIRVVIAAGVITDVELTSTRPVNACSILVGRPVAGAMATLPRLFSLCGVAQAVAGLTAAEMALGVAPSPSQTAARRLLVAAEALDQTLWRILLDWPRLIASSPALATLKQARRLLAALRPLLFPDPGWQRLGGAFLQPDHPGLAATLAELAGVVQSAVLGEDAFSDPLDNQPRFQYWLRSAATPAATALRFVLEHGRADFGRSAVQPFPAFEAPHWAGTTGAAGETGALARRWTHPLIAGLRADFGNGLLTRLTARVLETGALLAEMRELALAIAADPGSAPGECLAGAGVGVVECARGRLMHRLTVANSRVSAYQILAPTEANFHPQGPLARGLAGARTEPDTTLRQTIELLITAIDPCVGFDLAIETLQP